MSLSRRSLIASGAAGLAGLALSACGRTGGQAGPSAGSSEGPESPSASASSASQAPGVALQDISTVPHLFFHSLVADPQRAFDGDDQQAGYLDYMVTIPEFRKIIAELHRRDFQLVTPHQLLRAEADGRVTTLHPEITRGKKPLILSFDDLSYYEYMDGDGFAQNVTLHDGELTCTYTDAAGKTTTGEYDYVPILERFVAEHPEFSHAGAKGTVALTGYNGILGYRTSEISYGQENRNIRRDQETARTVAQAMKDRGWEFASHSWGHLNFTQEGVANLEADTRKWKAEVEPLVGPTDLLIYPFGADIAGVEPYTDANPKVRMLTQQGFHTFFNVDASQVAWWQIQPTTIRANRINVDGISLKAAIDGDNDVLQHFFDPRAVLDPARPASIAGS
ncbi:polysaccharide deacetylase family protein [Rothia kristinae]|uniref:polysaccharide deacetylase family protein n=1 Tax=Rothia kristinae TaxID=37923 RepID=UPI0021A7E9BD|nr:polysaccharide deacetylase family protein [Rothia kristinae]MCT1357374.1 polysaccharide deacetylase family protein [Rothia kristinae]MCT1393537.1 polysaccharide deacetylase family protein [Rothia kristinae]MCT1505297.1 polysaccharide deacetylase family protein [Rothia kristinae]MCT2037706.1 polysaccharide deacetylase family protein [Rothia kristinae]MCT2243610.1 polysaccharide deacetylase family protein [Rothia kristinae]